MTLQLAAPTRAGTVGVHLGRAAGHAVREGLPLDKFLAVAQHRYEVVSRERSKRDGAELDAQDLAAIRRELMRIPRAELVRQLTYETTPQEIEGERRAHRAWTREWDGFRKAIATTYKYSNQCKGELRKALKQAQRWDWRLVLLFGFAYEALERAERRRAEWADRIWLKVLDGGRPPARRRA